MPLAFAQELTGLGATREPHPRAPAPGRAARVRAALERLAAGRLNVEAIDYEERLFAKAAAASNQSTALFAAISALVGFLFAFNAMLLTVPQRRRLVVDLRRDGYATRDRDRGAGARRRWCWAWSRARSGSALGEELSIHLLALQPRVPLAGVRGRLAARRELADRRARRRRGHARPRSWRC